MQQLAEPLSLRPWGKVRQEVRPVIGKAWYAAHCIRETDEHALRWLGPTHFNYETYYPQVRELRPVPRNRQSQKERRSAFKAMRLKLVPFWPRYMLVLLDLGRDNWRQAFDVAGVGGMLCHGGMPAPISDVLVAKIRSREVDGALPGSMTVQAIFKFEIGEVVRITEGPFASFEGQIETMLEGAIEGIDPTARITVLANLFGRQTPVELEISQIAKL